MLLARSKSSRSRARSFSFCSLSFIPISLFSGLGLLGVESGHVERNPRAHRGANGNALHVFALGRRRLRSNYCLDQRVGVFEELVGGEADLTHGGMDHARLVH